MKGELRLVGSRGILSQPIVLLFVLHRFVPCHIETGIWDSQTTYCWAVYAPQICAEPHRDRDMIWDLGFSGNLLFSCLCSTGLCAAT